MRSMMRLKERPRKTLDDFFRLPEETRAELLEGEILMSPAPAYRHQRICMRLAARLDQFTAARGLGEVVTAPDVVLSRFTVVEPDIVFLKTGNVRIVKGRVRTVPDLLVEVTSTQPERDRLLKRNLYASFRVPEYWIVDPETRSIEVLVLKGSRYSPFGYFLARNVLTSPGLPGLRLKVASVFRA